MMVNQMEGKRRTFWNGVKIVGSILCILGFLFNSGKISKNFFKGSKMLAQNIETHQTLSTPSITICNRTAFKEPIDTFSELELNSYLNNTLSLDDVLVYPFFTNLKEADSPMTPFYTLDPSNAVNPFSISTTYTYFKGRCHTFEYKIEVSLNLLLHVYQN